jgi:hypothetical protein
MFYDFEAGNKTYKLRLNTRNIVSLEKQLGCNPLAIFGDGSTIPTVSTMVSVLFHAMQQYNHGITLDSAYDIFDAYLDDGHSVTDFISVILEVYKVSGIIKDGSAGSANEKN